MPCVACFTENSIGPRTS